MCIIDSNFASQRFEYNKYDLKFDFFRTGVRLCDNGQARQPHFCAIDSISSSEILDFRRRIRNKKHSLRNVNSY